MNNVFNGKSNSVQNPENEDEADQSEEQFYAILRQQTEDTDEAIKTDEAVDAEEIIQANNTEQHIPANLQSNLEPGWALPEPLRTSRLRHSRNNEKTWVVYEVLDEPRNVLEALHVTECDMREDAKERELEALADYGTFEYGTNFLTHVHPIMSRVVP